MGRGGKFSVRPNNQTPPSFLYHPVIPAKETVQQTNISSFLRKQESSKTAKPVRVFHTTEAQP